MHKFHHEHHRLGSVGWLRAAVLGANDGIVSTSCLLLGVVAAGAGERSILLTGIAGLVAGAMSMATGEYVSVHSQADTEQAALNQEQRELAQDPQGEQRELAAIYIRRGLDAATAGKVAEQLTAHNALDAHARDELGISQTFVARPLQAAAASAACFSVGAIVPLAVVLAAPSVALMPAICVTALVSLALLGGVAAKAGGANVIGGALRVSVWSSLAMAVTAAVGALVGTAV